jgi:hypothetical protein
VGGGRRVVCAGATFHRHAFRVTRCGGAGVILSGTRDQHTTLEEAHAIFAAAHVPKSIWEVDGAPHVNLHSYAKAEYEQRVAAFLAAYLR